MPKALDGLKVADFCWVGVGPLTMKSLADNGATVVHIESHTRVETLRNGGPFKDRVPGVNRSGFFANFNSSKLGVSLNLNTAKGREVARRLIAWADVVGESFTPGTMKGWGLDYESVRQWKPDIIYYSTCQLGQTGPWASQPGYGTQLAALAGFYHLASWPGAEPAGPYGAYTDFISPRFGIVAVMAALEQRRRTGRGAHVDLSQLEAGTQFVGPYLMDWLNNGNEPELLGNRDPLAAPHGAYPCKGPLTPAGVPDRWIAIAVRTSEEWLALRRVMGNPPWAADATYASLEGRKAAEDEIDTNLAAWTSEHDANDLMRTLQAAGIPAGAVQTSHDLYQDAQLAHWGAFVELDHVEIGRHKYDGLSYHLSRTPGELTRPGPGLGQHNEEVYRGLLGMSEAEYDSLLAEGVFE